MHWEKIRGAIRKQWQAKTEHPDCVVASLRANALMKVSHARTRAEVQFVLDIVASDSFAARDMIACAGDLSLGRLVIENGRWVVRYATSCDAISDDSLPGILAVLEDQAVGLRARLHRGHMAA